jgi:hypothetical protein
MFEIQRVIEDYGIYLKNCLSQEDIDFIVSKSKDPSMVIKEQRAVYYVEVADDSTEKEIEIFNKVHSVMQKAMAVYTDNFKESIEDYTVTAKSYLIKTWKTDVSIGDHSDTWDPKNGEAVPYVTVVLYLSSDFEGGEFVFRNGYIENEKDTKISIKPAAGDILVFKSNISHWVNPVISGTRIATDLFYLK